MVTRHKELKRHIRTLGLTLRDAATLLSTPQETLSPERVDDYVKGRRFVPGWCLSWLEWEIAGK